MESSGLDHPRAAASQPASQPLVPPQLRRWCNDLRDRSFRPLRPSSVSVCLTSLRRSLSLPLSLSVSVSPSHLSVCQPAVYFPVVSGVLWPLWPRGCRVAGGVKGQRSLPKRQDRDDLVVRRMDPPPRRAADNGDDLVVAAAGGGRAAVVGRR